MISREPYIEWKYFSSAQKHTSYIVILIWEDILRAFFPHFKKGFNLSYFGPVGFDTKKYKLAYICSFPSIGKSSEREPAKGYAPLKQNQNILKVPLTIL